MTLASIINKVLGVDDILHDIQRSIPPAKELPLTPHQAHERYLSALAKISAAIKQFTNEASMLDLSGKYLEFLADGKQTKLITDAEHGGLVLQLFYSQNYFREHNGD